MSVKELRSLCSSLGVSPKGTKAELTARVEALKGLLGAGSEGAEAPTQAEATATKVQLASPVVIRDDNGVVITQVQRVGNRLVLAHVNEDGATSPSKRDSNVPRSHKSIPVEVAKQLPKYADEIAAMAL